MDSQQRGRGFGNPALQNGGESYCKCPKCGYEQIHDRNIPCMKISCPACGSKMMGKSKENKLTKYKSIYKESRIISSNEKI